MNFNKLTFEEKFGQMIMIGLDTYEINDEIIELIRKYKIGGIVLYKKNYTSIETMIELINKLKQSNKNNNIPLFIGIDQENGKVNRFPKEINKIYNASKQAKTGNLKIINSINDITTYLLKSFGININFAPVLDINKDLKNKSVGNRSYGSNKEDVIKYALPYMKIMKENNIISVVKHFPGHGATNKDSHFTIPYIKNLDNLINNDVVPFEKAIENGADAIMIDHVKLKGYGLNPATTNKRIIKENLINKYNYNGLIITDDLRMGYRKYIFGLRKKVEKSIEAGNDIIMIKYKKGDISKIYKALYKMVKNYEIDIEKINNSAKKIVNIKKKYQINDTLINSKLDIKLINKKIKDLNNLIDKELGESL